jgi:pimeloyl-ACP methyl ester carboxylesterase
MVCLRLSQPASADQVPVPGTTLLIYPNSPLQANDAVYGQLQFFQAYDVNGGYAAAGVGMRNRGYGTITLAGIPDGARTIAAYLYWDILASVLDERYEHGALNGVPLTGKLIGTHGDPCWGNTTNYAYRADVTELVSGNGSYELSGFASGYTDGRDPWVGGSIAPMTEGGSLVVIYELSSAPRARVLLYDGSILSRSNLGTFTLDHFTITDTLSTAVTTFIGADGQSAAETDSTFNGTILPSVSWDGLDPQDGPDFINGNLWDTMTVDVTSLLPAGSTSATATFGPGSDCLVWTTQVLALTDTSSELDCSAANLDLQPLLLIHGWGGPDTIEDDDQGFAQLQSLLTNDMGYVLGCNLFYARGVKASFTPIYNRVSISANLRLAYDQMAKIDPDWRGHFDIIGHSYGGLNARFYLESSNYEIDQEYESYGIHIDNLFTLGSPHGGVSLPEELYPASVIIGAGHLNNEEWLSAYDLLEEQMQDYNKAHTQPEGVCYRPIGGDFINQPGLREKAPVIYTLYSRFWKTPNDIGVSLRSSLNLATNPDLHVNYPHVVGYPNLDMHGYAEELSLGDVRSYVKPNDTFNALVRPLLDPGPDACEQDSAGNALPISAAESEDSTTPSLISTGEILPYQTINGSMPVDWSGSSSFYVSSMDGLVDLKLWNPDGVEINPVLAESDPNIGYVAVPFGAASLVTYIFTDTLPGAWTYQIYNPASQAAPFDFYLLGESQLAFDVSTPYWLPLNAAVPITATLSAASQPVSGAIVKAMITGPEDIQSQIYLYDDGNPPDALAGDGIYSAEFANTSSGGLYHALIKATGVYETHDFLRSSQVIFTVSSGRAALSGSYVAAAVDADVDGFYESLDIEVGFEVQELGALAVSGLLHGPNGEPVAAASALVTPVAGLQTVQLVFPASAIAASKVSGPYTLALVTILDDGTFIRLDQDTDAFETLAYDYWDFYDEPIQLYLPLAGKE